MRANGANVAYPLTLVDHRVLQHDGETLTTVACKYALPIENRPDINKRSVQTMSFLPKSRSS
jgi:hypothetical protein